MSAKAQRKAKAKVKRDTSKRRRVQSKFCVIAVTAISRRWFDTEAEAVEHAKPMLRINAGQSDKATRVMVVKARKIVELAQPHPPLTVRAPQDYDFAPSPRTEALEEYRRLRRNAYIRAGIEAGEPQPPRLRGWFGR